MLPLPAIPILFSFLLAPQDRSSEFAGARAVTGRAGIGRTSIAPVRAVRAVRAARTVREVRPARASRPEPMIRIPAGSYRALYGRRGDAPASVPSFRIDRTAVTRGAFLAFVAAKPEWRRSAVSARHAVRSAYLADWRGDLDAGDADDLRRPVTGISWFVAKAFCAAQGKRLPTVAEWEYVAAASATRREATRDPAFAQQLLVLYATRPRPIPPADRGEMNAFGVRGLHGLVWEWVADFDGVPVSREPHGSHESHGAGGRDHDLFCASAAIGAADPSNYAAFLRSALRGGLTTRTSLETLGFRCAA